MNQSAEEHFVAYHSIRTMGHDLEYGDLQFLSKKLGHLRKALGHKVWVIRGSSEGKKTTFSLWGVYIATGVTAAPSLEDVFVISGPTVEEFSPPIALDDLTWFPDFKKSQSNFSLGFNRISDLATIHALQALLPKKKKKEQPLPDLDGDFSAFEGNQTLVTHLRSERNQALVARKKEQILKKSGALNCEACGFDFFATYGERGRDFCEIHHTTPLAKLVGEVETKLSQLAVVCSNCHRMIHRTNPMLSVTAVAALLGTARVGRRPR